MKLVSLAQVKAHLRVDTDADDNDLNMKIEAASAMVVDYLKDYEFADFDSAGVILDTNGDPVNVKPHIQAPTMMLVGYLYKQRDGGMDESTRMQYGFTLGYGYMPIGVTALLYPYRVPTVA